MARRRHTPEQIIRISEASWHRWQNQYGGMKSEDAKKLEELERENARLEKMVADQALDIDMLEEISRGNFQTPTVAAAPCRRCETGSGYPNAARAR